jgi:glycosyltransferase involved in cell wall biosynthesis
MISILIPTYNYNAFPLVKELHSQCLEAEIDFEILCQDDASKLFDKENQQINTLEKCTFSKNKINLGRGQNINTLGRKATNPYLLLLDCDTFPKNSEYIQNYVLFIRKGKTDVLFGGIIYEGNRPEKENLLRWVFGVKREALSLEQRNKHPYKNALTSNLLIKKQIFTKCPFDSKITKYGYEDLSFLMVLKSKGFAVNHSENPTFHLNLETSEIFLEKTKTALENLAFIFESTKTMCIDSKVLSAYTLLKNNGLARLASRIFEKTETLLKYNLLSQKPSLLLFDLFKLGYFCKLQSAKSITSN